MTDVSSQNLRKTFATRLLSRGAAITVVRLLLGHASVKATKRAYAAFVKNERFKQTIDLLDKPVQPRLTDEWHKPRSARRSSCHATQTSASHSEPRQSCSSPCPACITPRIWLGSEGCMNFCGLPACERSRYEPRANWPRSTPCASPRVPVAGRCGTLIHLHIRYRRGRKHLPILQ